jgi:hypothetical protein|tara:strand:- start:127 stop:774 length:648 start_codon:yes stop_codon:yes gene_type:complete
MATIIIIEKNGNLKEVVSNEKDIYKKCGLTKENNFLKHHTWEVQLNNILYKIAFYGKNEGRANNENKYDLPPPLDNELFFGKCALVKINTDNEIGDINITLWNKIYEKLFGGFENLDDMAMEDEEEEDELDDVPSNMKTKDGYLKDNFVVDENEEIENDNDEDDDEEEEFDEEINDSMEDDDIGDELLEDDDNEDIFNEIGSELSEENYIYSDED